jgi:hypothetical protein
MRLLPKRGALAALGAAAITIGFGPIGWPAFANELGPLSGSARVGCGNGCHGDATNPAITLEVPATTDGTATALPMRVAVDDPMPGGGGFMLEASYGRIDVGAAAGIRNENPNEVTHDGTQPLLRSWTFEWVATGGVPTCVVDVRAAVMATNLDRDYRGDHWGSVSSSIAVVPATDSAPPANPRFVSPAPGAVVNKGANVSAASGKTPLTVVIESVVLRIDATDDTGVRGVVVHDTDATGADTQVGAAAYDPKSRQWVLPWSTAELLPGPHVLRAIATDCGGNTSAAAIDVFALP